MEALKILTQAESELGSNIALSEERFNYYSASTIARVESQVELRPRTSWEHYALGRSFMQHQRLKEASEEFQRAADLQPQAFWPHFYQGVSAYRQGELESALASFSACIALKPDQVECHSNRALVFHELGREDLATRDLERARRKSSREDAATN